MFINHKKINFRLYLLLKQILMNTPKLNCIIVDDDLIDRLTTQSFVQKFAQFNIVGVFESAVDALQFIANNKVDILFLDIDMPDISGIEFRKKCLEIPVCIFITAHPEHAAESFELDTLDFIIKPPSQERFEQTVRRIDEFMAIKQKALLYENTITDNFIFLKEGHDQYKININEVLYLEAMKDYTLIITPQKRHCVLITIGKLLQDKAFEHFCRIHRSFAVNKQFVKKISALEIVLSNNTTIPVGRNYKSNIIQLK